MKNINVALLGLGTVGTGVLQVLQKNKDEITRRCGANIDVSMVCVRDLSKDRDCDLRGIKIVTDYMAVVTNPEVDIVVELMGGIIHAKDAVMAAIMHRKTVVTANKALIALFGNDIFKAAREHEVMVAYEAAVAGGIPIIKTLREGLAANRIKWLAGIVNGTCNYILSTIEKEGVNFDAALARAQQLGFAEADPSADIDGLDAAHKIAILSSLAFGIPLQFDQVSYEGIRDVTLEDIQYAKDFGFRIKSLAMARRDQARGISINVCPALVSTQHILAHVQNEMNAVMVEADMVGPSVYIGAGAGSDPTASAVVADLIDMSRSMSVQASARVPVLAFQSEGLQDLPQFPLEAQSCAQYIRLHAVDLPGVMADVATLLANNNISIELLQQHRLGNNRVAIVMMTHEALESDVRSVLLTLNKHRENVFDVLRLRVADLL